MDSEDRTLPLRSKPGTATSVSEGKPPLGAQRNDSGHERSPTRRSSLAGKLGFVRFSGIYGLGVLVVVFWKYDAPLFLSTVTFKSILAGSAISGIVALGAVVPFSAGMLDLQFGYVAGFGLVLFTWLSVHVGGNDGVLAVVTVVASTALGLASGLIVARLRVNSLIVTLGMGSIAVGMCYLLIGTSTVEANLTDSAERVGTSQLGPVPVPVLILLGLALILNLWLERSASGRELRLVGSSEAAARASGLNVPRLQAGGLAVSSLIAGGAGVLWCTQIGFGNSSDGSALVFPAISAVLLGSTQLRNRVNVPGTVVAILIIQTAVDGFDLHAGGSAAWPSNAFSGGLLLLAISLVALSGRRKERGRTHDESPPVVST